MASFETKNVCTKRIDFAIDEEDKVRDVKFEGGCVPKYLLHHPALCLQLFRQHANTQPLVCPCFVIASPVAHSRMSMGGFATGRGNQNLRTLRPAAYKPF